MRKVSNARIKSSEQRAARRHLRRAHSAAGMTLIEVLVAMGIFAAVTAIIAMIVVSSNSVTTTAQEGVYTQASLLDAVNRVTRDTSAAVPIMAALDNDVTFKVQQGGRCAQSRYYLNTTGVLTSEVRTAATAQCPESWATIAPSTTVLATKITTEHIFTYYDFQNRVLPAPVKDLTLVARVGIAVKAAVKDRPNGVNLVTSAAIATGISPNLTVMTNGTVATPTLKGTLTGNTGTLTWTSDPTYTGFVLYRDGVVLARINDPATLTYDDPRLSPGTTYVYTIVGISAAGTSQPSNPVTLKPVVGVLPNNPASGPTTVSVDEPPADGCTTTTVIKDSNGTGGLTADYCQATVPGQPQYKDVTTDVPTYGWTTQQQPVYGPVPGPVVPVMGWIPTLVPHYEYVPTVVEDYGWITTTTPTYGWTYPPVTVPVYGPVPVWKTVYKSNWVKHSDRTLMDDMKTKCWKQGTAPIPYPDCYVRWDNSQIIRYSPSYGNFFMFNGSLKAGPDDRVMWKTRMQAGEWDAYWPMKPGVAPQPVNNPDFGNFYPTQPGDDNGRWNGPSGYGWYYVGTYQRSFRWEVVSSSVVQDGTKQGIIGYETKPGPGVWAQTGTTTTQTWGVTGSHIEQVWTQTGWDTKMVWGQTGTEQTYVEGIVGYKPVQVWGPTGGTTPVTTSVLAGYAPVYYVRTYVMRWAGQGPCPTVSNLPMTVITHNANPRLSPVTLNLQYDSSTQLASLTESDHPDVIMTVSIPKACTY